MKVSLAITTYNRYDLTIKSFGKVLNDERIDDIVLLDDSSTDGSFEKLNDTFAREDKVRVVRQVANRGMSQNKADAIAYAKNEWVPVLDSDNVFDQPYLDAFFDISKQKSSLDNCTIYCPQFARPGFDYRAFSGLTIDRENVKSFMGNPMFRCLLNTANYVVPRDTYLSVYEHDPSIKGTDTIWMNYLWLKKGYSLCVVPGMEYDHLQHSGSGFLQDLAYNMEKGREIEQKIMEL